MALRKIWESDETYSEDEYNRMLDQWVEARNNHIGETYKPQLGVWPPNKMLYETQINEWVTTDLIRHFCDAISDYKNPLWRSEDYARDTEWGGIIAPPLFIDSIASSFVDPCEDIHAPTPTYHRPPGIHGWPAGSTCEFFHVMRPGDRIRVIDTFLGIEEKHPETHYKERGYRLFRDLTKRTYINQRDEVVATAVSPLIRIPNRPGAPAVAGKAHPDRPHPNYTEEYLERIYQGYEDEKPRGAEKRYWEDVVVGEQAQTIVAGPLDANDNAMYQGVTGINGTFAFKYFWNKVQPGGIHYPIDPVTGDYSAGARSHLDGPIRKAHSGTRPYGWGGQAWGLLSRLVTNWMGDDGFLKRFDTRMKQFWYFEECAWMNGKVVKKYVDGEEHLVDLELEMKTQDDFVFMTGTATVRLPWHAGT
jgi:acyl dehydratase